MRSIETKKLVRERATLLRKVTEINLKLRKFVGKPYTKQESLDKIYEVKTQKKGEGRIENRIILPQYFVGKKVKVNVVEDFEELEAWEE